MACTTAICCAWPGGSTRCRSSTTPGTSAAAGARALFEIAVDLALFRYGRDSPVQKLLDWEQSAKLKAAEDRLSVPGPLPDGEDESVYRQFVDKNGAAIRASRQRWGWSKHPSRWTGRSLRTDAERCDKLSGSQHGMQYRFRYVELCWNTHGSGFVGIRGVSASVFPAVSGLCFHDAGLFARTAAEHVLALLDRYDDSMVERFAQLDRDCVAARLEAVAAAKERERSGG